MQRGWSVPIPLWQRSCSLSAIDHVSFWIGFVAATLSVDRPGVRPAFRQLRGAKVKQAAKSAQYQPCRGTLSTNRRTRRRKACTWRRRFALDEVVIPPAAPGASSADRKRQPAITMMMSSARRFAHLPAWPELAAICAGTLTTCRSTLRKSDVVLTGTQAQQNGSPWRAWLPYQPATTCPACPAELPFSSMLISICRSSGGEPLTPIVDLISKPPPSWIHALARFHPAHFQG